MSDHKCEIVPIILEKHPNADKLSIVRVFDNYQVCVRTEDWSGIDKGVFIPPDSIVPDTEQFKFLEGHLRIRARKFRGIESYGLLVPVPIHEYGCICNEEHHGPFKLGDDCAQFMGIKHFEPEMAITITQGNMFPPPPIPGVIYDMESWQKYGNEFVTEEEVIITEKIHGTNARFTFQDDKMHCGSHKCWKQEGDNLYWNILKIVPWIEAFCRLNPNVILYGEIFGAIQKGFKYGTTSDNPYQFRAFDVFSNGRFLDYDNALGGAKSDFLVPVLYRGPYSKDVVLDHVSGMTTFAGNHIREGIVIKPVKERYSERLHGRLILKYVSLDYLEGKKKLVNLKNI